MPSLRLHSVSLAILALALLPASGTAADTPDSGKTIVRDGMSIQLPKGWASEESPAGRTVLIAHSPDKEKDDTGEFPTTLTIALHPAKPDGKAIQEANARELKDYKPVEAPRDLQINGAAGVTLGGTFTQGVLKLRTRQYVLSSGDKGFVITLVMLESRWDKYHQLAEAAIATFHIGDAAKK